MDINNFFQSKSFRIAIAVIGSVALVLLIFGLGVFVGFKKASFSYQWGENYNRNFAGPKGGFMGDFRGKDFIDANGMFGQIIKIDSSADSNFATLVVKGKNNVENIVLIKNDTAIRRIQEDIRVGDLKVDDYIVVIGSPNSSGQIEAKLIRIMPPPPVGRVSPQFPPNIN